MHFENPPTDEEMLRFVEEWIDLLARGRFEEAYRHTEHDPYYRWTPGLIRAVIEGYGLPEPHPSGTVLRVTDRATATGGPPRPLVERSAARPNVIAEIWYDLPLNGEWSDLTATFRVESRCGGSAVVLEEIHVF